jgi:hypothetical protein
MKFELFAEKLKNKVKHKENLRSSKGKDVCHWHRKSQKAIGTVCNSLQYFYIANHGRMR